VLQVGCTNSSLNLPAVISCETCREYDRYDSV
jgi:hypothetical protein